VIITDIYASAREKKQPGISGRLLAQEVSKFHPQVNFKGNKEEVSKFLPQVAKPGDVVFTMGAGDIFLWHKNILEAI
jgi:UDP-N-acetylmuramate--alanine ligase